MYKITVMDDPTPIYDSINTPLPNGEVYFHTHQMLWKNNVKLGRIAIGKTHVKLILGDNKPITFPRNTFQELFMNDAQIVALIFAANEVKSVQLILHQKNHIFSSHDIRSARLYKLEEQSYTFYGDIVFTLK